MAAIILVITTIVKRYIWHAVPQGLEPCYSFRFIDLLKA